MQGKVGGAIVALLSAVILFLVVLGWVMVDAKNEILDATRPASHDHATFRSTDGRNSEVELTIERRSSDDTPRAFAIRAVAEWREFIKAAQER